MRRTTTASPDVTLAAPLAAIVVIRSSAIKAAAILSLTWPSSGILQRGLPNCLGKTRHTLDDLDPFGKDGVD